MPDHESRMSATNRDAETLFALLPAPHHRKIVEDFIAVGVAESVVSALVAFYVVKTRSPKSVEGAALDWIAVLDMLRNARERAAMSSSDARPEESTHAVVAAFDWLIEDANSALRGADPQHVQDAIRVWGRLRPAKGKAGGGEAVLPADPRSIHDPEDLSDQMRRAVALFKNKILQMSPDHLTMAFSAIEDHAAANALRKWKRELENELDAY